MICVVPARMSSSRFPGKPLVEIAGVPLVVRSALRGRLAGCFEQVVVATEDREIVSVAREHGFDALLTPSFETGTDRVAWAARELGARHVVNLQGDEPLFPLDLLRELARRVPTDPDALWTAADLALSDEERLDEDVVKIVLDPLVELAESSGLDAETDRDGFGGFRHDQPASRQIGRAFDFHRILSEETGDARIAVHVGVYAGSTELLGRFSALPSTDQERFRRIEPLRAIAHGIEVRAILGKWNRVAIDRMEHISRVLDVLRTRGE